MSNMSDRSGYGTKGDKSKNKYASLNLSTTYEGKCTELRPTKTAQTRHGLQSLGKVPTSRRAPPPASLPSLKSESGGNDPNISLVPSGSAGWGTTSKESSGNLSAQNVRQLGSQQVTNIQVASSIQGSKSQSQSGQPEQQACGRRWGAVTSSVSEKVIQRTSPYFNQEFPTLDKNAPHPRDGEPAKDEPSLRPQKEGSWREGGGSKQPPLVSPESPTDISKDSETAVHQDDDEATSRLPANGSNVSQQYRPAPMMPNYMYQARPQYQPYPPYVHGPPPRMPYPTNYSGYARPPMMLHRGPPASGRPSIIKQQDLEDLDRLEDSWANTQPELDYNEQLKFSDDEDETSQKNELGSKNLEREPTNREASPPPARRIQQPWRIPPPAHMMRGMPPPHMYSGPGGARLHPHPAGFPPYGYMNHVYGGPHMRPYPPMMGHPPPMVSPVDDEHVGSVIERQRNRRDQGRRRIDSREDKYDDVEHHHGSGHPGTNMKRMVAPRFQKQQNLENERHSKAGRGGYNAGESFASDNFRARESYSPSSDSTDRHTPDGKTKDNLRIMIRGGSKDSLKKGEQEDAYESSPSAVQDQSAASTNSPEEDTQFSELKKPLPQQRRTKGVKMVEKNLTEEVPSPEDKPLKSLCTDKVPVNKKDAEVLPPKKEAWKKQEPPKPKEPTKHWDDSPNADLGLYGQWEDHGTAAAKKQDRRKSWSDMVDESKELENDPKLTVGDVKVDEKKNDGKTQRMQSDRRVADDNRSNVRFDGRRSQHFDENRRSQHFDDNRRSQYSDGHRRWPQYVDDGRPFPEDSNRHPKYDSNRKHRSDDRKKQPLDDDRRRPKYEDGARREKRYDGDQKHRPDSRLNEEENRRRGEDHRLTDEDSRRSEETLPVEDSSSKGKEDRPSPVDKENTRPSEDDRRLEDDESLHHGEEDSRRKHVEESHQSCDDNRRRPDEKSRRKTDPDESRRRGGENGRRRGDLDGRRRGDVDGRRRGDNRHYVADAEGRRYSDRRGAPDGSRRLENVGGKRDKESVPDESRKEDGGKIWNQKKQSDNGKKRDNEWKHAEEDRRNFDDHWRYEENYPRHGFQNEARKRIREDDLPSKRQMYWSTPFRRGFHGPQNTWSRGRGRGNPRYQEPQRWSEEEDVAPEPRRRRREPLRKSKPEKKVDDAVKSETKEAKPDSSDNNTGTGSIAEDDVSGQDKKPVLVNGSGATDRNVRNVPEKPTGDVNSDKMGRRDDRRWREDRDYFDRANAHFGPPPRRGRGLRGRGSRSFTRSEGGTRGRGPPIERYAPPPARKERSYTKSEKAPRFRTSNQPAASRREDESDEDSISHEESWETASETGGEHRDKRPGTKSPPPPAASTRGKRYSYSSETASRRKPTSSTGQPSNRGKRSGTTEVFRVDEIVPNNPGVIQESLKQLQSKSYDRGYKEYALYANNNVTGVITVDNLTFPLADDEGGDFTKVVRKKGKRIMIRETDMSGPIFDDRGMTDKKSEDKPNRRSGKNASSRKTSKKTSRKSKVVTKTELPPRLAAKKQPVADAELSQPELAGVIGDCIPHKPTAASPLTNAWAKPLPTAALGAIGLTISNKPSKVPQNDSGIDLSSDPGSVASSTTSLKNSPQTDRLITVVSKSGDTSSETTSSPMRTSDTYQKSSNLPIPETSPVIEEYEGVGVVLAHVQPDVTLETREMSTELPVVCTNLKSSEVTSTSGNPLTQSLTFECSTQVHPPDRSSIPPRNVLQVQDPQQITSNLSPSVDLQMKIDSARKVWDMQTVPEHPSPTSTAERNPIQEIPEYVDQRQTYYENEHQGESVMFEGNQYDSNQKIFEDSEKMFDVTNKKIYDPNSPHIFEQNQKIMFDNSNERMFDNTVSQPSQSDSLLVMDKTIFDTSKPGYDAEDQFVIPQASYGQSSAVFPNSSSVFNAPELGFSMTKQDTSPSCFSSNYHTGIQLSTTHAYVSAAPAFATQAFATPLQAQSLNFNNFPNYSNIMPATDFSKVIAGQLTGTSDLSKRPRQQHIVQLGNSNMAAGNYAGHHQAPYPDLTMIMKQSTGAQDYMQQQFGGHGSLFADNQQDVFLGNLRSTGGASYTPKTQTQQPFHNLAVTKPSGASGVFVGGMYADPLRTSINQTGLSQLFGSQMVPTGRMHSAGGQSSMFSMVPQQPPPQPLYQSFNHMIAPHTTATTPNIAMKPITATNQMQQHQKQQMQLHWQEKNPHHFQRFKVSQPQHFPKQEYSMQSYKHEPMNQNYRSPNNSCFNNPIPGPFVPSANNIQQHLQQQSTDFSTFSHSSSSCGPVVSTVHNTSGQTAPTSMPASVYNLNRSVPIQPGNATVRRNGLKMQDPSLVVTSIQTTVANVKTTSFSVRTSGKPETTQSSSMMKKMQDINVKAMEFQPRSYSPQGEFPRQDFHHVPFDNYYGPPSRGNHYRGGFRPPYDQKSAQYSNYQRQIAQLGATVRFGQNRGSRYSGPPVRFQNPRQRGPPAVKRVSKPPPNEDEINAYRKHRNKEKEIEKECPVVDDTIKDGFCPEPSAPEGKSEGCEAGFELDVANSSRDQGQPDWQTSKGQKFVEEQSTDTHKDDVVEKACDDSSKPSE